MTNPAFNFDNPPVVYDARKVLARSSEIAALGILTALGMNKSTTFGVINRLTIQCGTDLAGRVVFMHYNDAVRRLKTETRFSTSPSGMAELLTTAKIGKIENIDCVSPDFTTYLVIGDPFNNVHIVKIGKDGNKAVVSAGFREDWYFFSPDQEPEFVVDTTVDAIYDFIK